MSHLSRYISLHYPHTDYQSVILPVNLCPASHPYLLDQIFPCISHVTTAKRPDPMICLFFSVIILCLYLPLVMYGIHYFIPYNSILPYLSR